MGIFPIIVGVLVALLAYIYYKGTRKPSNFPPGPPRWPVIGSLVDMFAGEGGKTSILKTHQKFRAKYGPIHSFYAGNYPVVVVSDYKVMTELFKDDNAMGRAPFAPFHKLRPGAMHRDTSNFSWTPGIIGSSGKEWQEQRRFALRNLREFGFGKSSMDELFDEEISRLCALFRKDVAAGRPSELNNTVNISIVNSLWKILTGKTFDDLEDPNLRKVAELISDMLSKFGPLSPATILLPDRVFPLPFFDWLSGWKQSKDCVDSLLTVIKPEVEQHEKTFDENDMRDFIDVYLKNIKECKDSTSSFFKQDGLNSLLGTMLDLFIAGSDTTSTSLVWAILYMIQHPDIQTRVQEELDSVFGRSSMPNLSATTKELPYTNAVISEMFRKTSLAHMGVPHFALDDCKAGPYNIPKGSTIFQNLYHIHHDPTYWKEPERFNPDRFLDSDGVYHPDERLHPFGVGKRYCLGQTLAEKEFFLFVTGLLHSFRFERVVGEELPGYGIDVSHPMNVVRVCPDYRAKLTDRMAQNSS